MSISSNEGPGQLNQMMYQEFHADRATGRMFQLQLNGQLNGHNNHLRVYQPDPRIPTRYDDQGRPFQLQVNPATTHAEPVYVLGPHLSQQTRQTRSRR